MRCDRHDLRCYVLVCEDLIQTYVRGTVRGTCSVSKLRGNKRSAKRSARRVRIGVPDGSLTALAGLAAVDEVTAGLGIVGALDRGIGPIKQRAPGVDRRATAAGDGDGATGRAGLSRITCFCATLHGYRHYRGSSPRPCRSVPVGARVKRWPIFIRYRLTIGHARPPSSGDRPTTRRLAPVGRL